MHETNGEKHSEGSFKITREMKNITCFCVLILFLGIYSCSVHEYKGDRPKYVFFLIGDGMGSSQVTGTQFYLTERAGRIVQMEGERVVIQVFEGTNGIALDNTRTRLLGHPVEMPLSPELLGRIFDGSGRPIDGLGDIFPVEQRDINGTAINPVSRVYPRNFIETGISSIDCMMTLIRGQKLPIFSASGLPHAADGRLQASDPDFHW